MSLTGQDYQMSNFNAQDAQYNRNNRTQVPEYAPGQAPSSSGSFDIFGPPSSSGSLDIFGPPSSPGGNGSMDIFGSMNASNPMQANTNGVADIFNLGGGAANPFAPGAANMNPNAQAQSQQSTEDLIFDKTKDALVGGFNYIKDITKSLQDTTPLFWTVYGFRTMTVSGVFAGLGMIARLFGYKPGFTIFITSLVLASLGAFLWLITTDAAKKCTSKYKSNNAEVQPPSPPVNDVFNTPSPVEDMSLMSSNFSESNIEDSFETDEFEEDEYEDDDDDDEVAPPMDIETALDNFQVIDRGMYTRQYLYDTFIRVLPNLCPNFTKSEIFEEDDEKFLYWDEILTDAAEVTGLKEEDIPVLQTLEETLFSVKLTITRTAKMKPELLAQECAAAYAYAAYEDDAEKRASVFAKAEVVRKDCVITIFTGKSHMVSLKDMYGQCKDWVLNSKNYMPVVLGINEAGKVIYSDFKNVESIITAGMPRSGKTWEILAIITQLSALLSPKELNFYILDPKAGTSDFKAFKVPHVRKFACKYKDANGEIMNKEYIGVLDTLRELVNKEAPRRKKLLGDADCVNIKDFKDLHPDVDLPYIFVIIDEMVTLASMEKDDCKEYMTYLDQIVTQFPNLGIRAMFIPHRVTNQIISKTAYANIKSRISVKGSPDHIEATTETKPKDFPYKLTNTGDMALSMDTVSAKTLYVHGVVLTDTNAGNMKLFDYIRRIWAKLEPDVECITYAPQGVSDAAQKPTPVNSVITPKLSNETTQQVFASNNGAELLGFDDITDETADDAFDIFS